MLQLLSHYLWQYKKVSIPHVGTIELIQQPPLLSVADKIIQPPTYSMELKKEENVSEHQLRFLNSFLGNGQEAVLKELEFFGDKLHDKINGPGFEWHGLGTITRGTQNLPLSVSGLEAVRAEKVIRADGTHTVLVGDREMTATRLAEQKLTIQPLQTTKSAYLLIAWILLLLSILAIAILLYTGRFTVNAAGSRLHAATAPYSLPITDYSFS